MVETLKISKFSKKHLPEQYKAEMMKDSMSLRTGMILHRLGPEIVAGKSR